MCLCLQCFRYSGLWTNRPPGMLLRRCDFPIDNSHVSGRVHSTNRTNQSNRWRWTAGSVVSNEMRFSDQQHPGFGSCPFDESVESIDPTGFIASLQLMRCNFPIDKSSLPMESTRQYWTWVVDIWADTSSGLGIVCPFVCQRPFAATSPWLAPDSC